MVAGLISLAMRKRSRQMTLYGRTSIPSGIDPGALLFSFIHQF
jgi:hypothetical protein